MLDFVFCGENFPFALALGVMLGLALLEGVGALFGIGLSSVLDDLLPDFDFGLDAGLDADIDVDVDVDLDADVDADAELDAGSSTLARAISWLHVGKVPMMVLLVLFLTSFGLSGYIFQGAVLHFSGSVLPSAVAGAVALLATLPVVHIAGGVVAKLIPSDESSAVSQNSFLGQAATITLGKAEKGHPAEAKLRDQHGQTHYVLVEPMVEGEVFEAGETVLLIRDRGAVFCAART